MPTTIIPLSLDHLPDAAILRLPTVLVLTGCSRSGWWDGVKTGRYPKQVKIGARSVGWRAGDIRALLATFQEVTQPDPNVVRAAVTNSRLARRRADLIEAVKEGA